jgi:hypothetical protein
MKKNALIISVIGIFLIFQPLGAQTWQKAKRLTWNPGTSWDPELAIDSSDNIHVVWEDNSMDSNYEIYYKKSTDGGGTWSTTRLTFTSYESANPAISIDTSDNIHVVWTEGDWGSQEIYYNGSTDGGATWSTKKRLTWSSGNSYDPAITADSGNKLHVVWQDETPGHYEIYHKSSTNGGGTWSMTKRLTWWPDDSSFPIISEGSSGTFHLFWTEVFQSNINTETLYKRSADGGVTWPKAKRLTWSAGLTHRPKFSIGPVSTINIVWQDKTSGNYEVYYKKSTDEGATWAGTKRLTWNSGGSHYPVIAQDSSNAIHVVWHDATPPNIELFYKKSTDGGTSWSTQRLTWNSGGSYTAHMAIDSNDDIHIVWYDYTTGDSEIHYKKGIQ